MIEDTIFFEFTGQFSHNENGSTRKKNLGVPVPRPPSLPPGVYVNEYRIACKKLTLSSQVDPG